MKFGKNLAYLSIPEWKAYNLDYNDLKSKIREATRSPHSDLTSLHEAFVENFNYLNLFVLSKSGELSRKLKVCRNEFQLIEQDSNSSNAERLSNLTSLHYQIINEISGELRKLTKFILVQKIAVKKILKKFKKHYPNEALGQAFIGSLTQILMSNPKSFLNYDLTHLTTELLNLLDNVTRELNSLNELVHKKYLYEPTQGQHLPRPLISTAKSSRTITTLGSSPESAIDPRVEFSVDHIGKFDLVSNVKKNFSLHTIIPKDVISRNDVCLSIEVYLNMPKLGNASRVLITYLTTGIDDANPSSIISYEELDLSIIIAFTGGLRKYGYCSLPNSITEVLLEYLNAQGKTRATLETKLLRYLDSSDLSNMTRLTLNHLIGSDLKPSLKIVCTRTRYYLSKDSTQHENEDDVKDTLSASPYDNDHGPESNTPSTVDTKVYEDSYYMHFDEDIFTTNEIHGNVLFDTSTMDPFPFNKFSIYSNDSKLHHFESSLQSTITENILDSKYKAITLKKMPVKLQNFVSNTSVHMLKNLSIYDYMRSCYFNVVPDDINNHYSKLLNINLFKAYENVENVTKQTNVDETISQDKSRSILKRQMSCKSLNGLSLRVATPVNERTSLFDNESVSNSRQTKDAQTSIVLSTFYDTYHNPYAQRYNDLETLDDNEEEDSYFIYLTFNSELEHNFLNNVLLSFIKFKHRVRRAMYAFRFLDANDSIWKHHKQQFSDHRGSSILNYDSLNEDPTYLTSEDDYKRLFICDYDHVLSILYFTLAISALFISGINLGIVYGLLKLQEEDVDFGIFNNLSVVSILVLGYLFALIFGMTSINLSFHRFREVPTSHSCIIWVAFIAVASTIFWTGAALVS